MTNDVWLAYSKLWNNRVISWVCEGVSGSYGLIVFDSGLQRRQIVSCDGEVVADKGDPLPEECHINWNEVGESEILEIASQMGADFDFLVDRDYLCFQLTRSHAEHEPGSSKTEGNRKTN